MPPGGARQQQYARQDRLFGALERLESKDTQGAAFEELQRLIKVRRAQAQGARLCQRAMQAPPPPPLPQPPPAATALAARHMPTTLALTPLLQELDAANLSTLLHAAGTQTAKTTQFARVHSLRLSVLCTAQPHCLQWREMLRPPLLPKLLSLLARALRDGDSAVRTAASDGFGMLAQQLAAAYPPGSEATGEKAAVQRVLYAPAPGGPAALLTARHAP